MSHRYEFVDWLGKGATEGVRGYPQIAWPWESCLKVTIWFTCESAGSSQAAAGHM